MLDYYRSPRTGICAPLHRDGRLSAKETVLGVVLDGQATAYPIQLLKKVGVLHDTLGRVPLLVVFDETAAAARAFDSRVNGFALTFFLCERKLMDYQTRSCWSHLSGRALHGSFAGRSMKPLPCTMAFWFAWKDFYPKTRVYTLPGLPH